MAADILYVNPQGESVSYEMDFAPYLPDDSALDDIGSGSTINAYDSAVADKGSTILSSKARTDLVLSVVIGSVLEGEDYRIEFLGKGATSDVIIIKVLEVRARRYIQGAS